MRVVIPSPNGATVSLASASGRAAVLCGCLRNAQAVARAARALGPAVGVVAAGERWDDPVGNGLRPCLEDLIGAGAILAALDSNMPSPEARAAMATFNEFSGNLAGALTACSSGRELIEAGHEEDIMVAAELDTSTAAPLMRDGAFTRSR